MTEEGDLWGQESICGGVAATPGNSPKPIPSLGARHIYAAFPNQQVVRLLHEVASRPVLDYSSCAPRLAKVEIETQEEIDPRSGAPRAFLQNLLCAGLARRGGLPLELTPQTDTTAILFG